MTRVETLRAMSRREEDRVSGTIDAVGDILIERKKHGVEGVVRRTYKLDGKRVAARTLYRKARRADASDGFQSLLMKKLAESRLEDGVMSVEEYAAEVNRLAREREARQRRKANAGLRLFGPHSLDYPVSMLRHYFSRRMLPEAALRAVGGAA